MTRILVIGDVMGKAGRRCLDELLPRLRAEHAPDFVVINGENVAGGFGITKKIYESLVTTQGIDGITMGNHWHDKREVYDFLPAADRMVLPGNMSNVDPEDRGLRLLRAANGQTVAVMNLLGRAFMHGENRCPLRTAERLLSRIPEHVRVRVVDMHAEATSEKQGLGWHLAGKVSLVYGTHSHVPTADDRIMAGHTGYVTDVGMTGPYDSVIGIRKEAAIQRLLTGEKKKFEPASGDLRLFAMIADIEDETGRCRALKRVVESVSGPASEDEN